MNNVSCICVINTSYNQLIREIKILGSIIDIISVQLCNLSHNQNDDCKKRKWFYHSGGKFSNSIDGCSILLKNTTHHLVFSQREANHASVVPVVV